MLTEKTIIDKIELVGEYRHVQVRKAMIIERDGQEVSRLYERYVITPGDDYSNQPEDVKIVCDAFHTPELIRAYKETQNVDTGTIA